MQGLDDDQLLYLLPIIFHVLLKYGVPIFLKDLTLAIGIAMQVVILLVFLQLPPIFFIYSESVTVTYLTIYFQLTIHNLLPISVFHNRRGGDSLETKIRAIDGLLGLLWDLQLEPLHQIC